MLGSQKSQLLSLDIGAALVDFNQPLAATRLLKVGTGEVRIVSISTTTQPGFLILLDAFDPPSNGDRPPLASFEVGANEDKHCPFNPPLAFERACLAVFSLAPYPQLKLSATVWFAGDCL